jgi:hypothetical protein
MNERMIEINTLEWDGLETKKNTTYKSSSAAKTQLTKIQGPKPQLTKAQASNSPHLP